MPMLRFKIRVRGEHEIRQLQTQLAMQSTPQDAVVQIGLIAIERDPAGEWVRFADVPAAKTCEWHETQTKIAERERDAAREAQRAAEGRRDDALAGQMAGMQAGAALEAELRTAREEVGELRAENANLAVLLSRHLKREADAAPPDAGWCYDASLAPRNDHELLVAAEGYHLHFAHRASDGAWYQNTSGCRLTKGPYAWRRVQAPPKPQAHQVPPVGSKL